MSDYLQDTKDGKENLFWTIEALNEQIGSLSYCIHNDTDRIEYHLKAIEKYGAKVFQACAALLPDLYKASDGNANEEVIARLHQYLESVQALRDAERAAYEARHAALRKSIEDRFGPFGGVKGA